MGPGLVMNVQKPGRSAPRLPFSPGPHRARRDCTSLDHISRPSPRRHSGALGTGYRIRIHGAHNGADSDGKLANLHGQPVVLLEQRLGRISKPFPCAARRRFASLETFRGEHDRVLRLALGCPVDFLADCSLTRSEPRAALAHLIYWSANDAHSGSKSESSIASSLNLASISVARFRCACARSRLPICAS